MPDHEVEPYAGVEDGPDTRHTVQLEDGVGEAGEAPPCHLTQRVQHDVQSVTVQVFSEPRLRRVLQAKPQRVKHLQNRSHIELQSI